MDELSLQLAEFLTSFYRKYKLSRAKLKTRLHANIEADLDIFDLDADMLINEFVERFDVDYSKFDWQTYGYPTGLTFIWFLRALFGRKKWIDTLAHKHAHTTFTIKVLEDAIISGELK